MRVRCSVAAALCILGGAAVWAQSAVMTADGFVAELDRLRAEVSSAGPGTVADIRSPAVWVIESSGERFETPAGWVRAGIENGRRNPSRWPEERRSILARIDALKNEAGRLSEAERLAAPVGNPAAVLADVLVEPEFKRLHERSLVGQLWERISQALLRVWERLGGGRLRSRSTALVFAWIAVLVAAGVLSAWIARVMLRAGGSRRPPMDVPAARIRSARGWAQDALAALDPREAIRCGYRATVRALEEEGIWRADPARTPREYLRLVPDGHRRRPPITDVARRFEEIWFGARPATEDDRRAVLSRLREIGCLPAD